jgi:hypothetical protein
MLISHAFRLSAIAVAFGCLLASGAAVGEEAKDDNALARHLAAGEFGPALDLANASPNAAERDRRLANIARVQASAGARAGAVATASSMSDASGRYQTLSGIGRDSLLGAPATPSGPLEGGRGGAAGADFDSLIELITTTIAPETWDEVGGAGAVDSFEGGVYVDSAGVLRKLVVESGKSLAALRAEAAVASENVSVRKPSGLRKVSLPRLERQLAMLRALGRDPDEAMDSLAGVYELKYVFVYPETGDVVLAGPAGEWTVDADGRRVNLATGKPTLRLDDLVVALRNSFDKHGRFGCSITPTRENLERTQAFLNASSKTPLSSDRAREKWLADLRGALGLQDIDIYGVDPRTRTGRVLVEADYHMKLVGMGLEEGVAGVTSYLDAAAALPEGDPSDFDVLRWWFTLNYDAISATGERDGFELKGPGVKVLSENELLDERGERIHTGKSNVQNSEFAHSFTAHFDELAQKHPVYGELRNIFDLALAAAIVRAEDLPGQAGWSMQYLASPKPEAGAAVAYELDLGPAPKQVETIINHKAVELRGGKSKRIVTGVSGGVVVDTAQLVSREAISVRDESLGRQRYGAAPEKLSRDAWWWD